MKIKMFIEVGLMILLLPFAFDGLKSAREIDFTQTVPNISATGSIANATLTKELFLDDVVNVKEVTSSVAGDVPAATIYDPATKRLTIDGIADTDPRTLHIEYGYARFDNTFDNIFGYLPLAFMGLLAWDIVKQFLKR